MSLVDIDVHVFQIEGSQVGGQFKADSRLGQYRVTHVKPEKIIKFIIRNLIIIRIN
jgi:hypothetical protein